jgi:hypothetical protein
VVQPHEWVAPATNAGKSGGGGLGDLFSG